MNISIDELKELTTTDEFSHPFETGRYYLLRTITHYWQGRVAGQKGRFLLLEKAAWIANTGRFAEAVKNSDFSEQEYIGNVAVNLEMIVDAIEVDATEEKTK